MNVRMLTPTEMDECARIREAARGCRAVFAAPATFDQARRLIKVIAGSDVEQLVIAMEGDTAPLEAYANQLGVAPLFVEA